MAATPTVQRQGVALDAGLEEVPRPKRLCTNIFSVNLQLQELEAPTVPLSTDGQCEVVTQCLDPAHHQEAFGQPAAHHQGPFVEAEKRLCTDSLSLNLKHQDLEAPAAPLSVADLCDDVEDYLNPRHHQRAFRNGSLPSDQQQPHWPLVPSLFAGGAPSPVTGPSAAPALWSLAHVALHHTPNKVTGRLQGALTRAPELAHYLYLTHCMAA